MNDDADPAVIEADAVRAFYAVCNETLARPECKAQCVRISEGKARLRISVDLSASAYIQQHVIEPSGACQRISAGYPQGEAQKDLCAALAPLAQQALAQLSHPDRVTAMAMLGDGRHYLRIHFFASGGAARCWRIIVALREIGAHVQGETAIALYDMQRPEQALLSATVH